MTGLSLRALASCASARNRSAFPLASANTVQSCCSAIAHDLMRPLQAAIVITGIQPCRQILAAASHPHACVVFIAVTPYA